MNPFAALIVVVSYIAVLAAIHLTLRRWPRRLGAVCLAGGAAWLTVLGGSVVLT